MEKHIQAMADHWSKLLICLLVMLNSQVVLRATAQNTNVTILESAVGKGAVCLDGSPPAYYYAEGFGDGVNNWLVYLEGGAWCDTTSDCLTRSQSWLGTSNSRKEPKYFNGILTSNATYNPDFYNWNRVWVVYCDGASFMGDVEEVDPKTNLTFRGARIFNAVVEDLLAKGMENAENVVLTGTSAGGLATILHCDSFRSLVPKANRVKCIVDSGFFIHAKGSLPGADAREAYFTKVADLHGLAKTLPASCASKMNPGLCLFPENLVGNIQTPLFILESAFDSYQIKEMLVPYVGGEPEWLGCTNVSLTLCTPTQTQVMKDFRSTFIKTLEEAATSCSSRGMFVHSCYLHGHIFLREGFGCSSVAHNVLGTKTIAEAVGDWYFDRSSFRQIDILNDLPKNCSTNLDFVGLNTACVRYLQHKRDRMVIKV